VLSKLRSTRSPGAFDAHRGHFAGGGHDPAALVQPVRLTEFIGQEFILARGQKYPFQALVARLREMDYDSETVCEAPGQYAVRGGIIGRLSGHSSQPCRLDFFGDEIEDIARLTRDPALGRPTGADHPGRFAPTAAHAFNHRVG